MSLLAGLSQQGDSIAAHNADSAAHPAVINAHKVEYHEVPAYTFDWHVDSVNGSDFNPGTLSAPFKTLSSLSGKIIDGAKIGLARGSVWYEELLIAVPNVTVGVFGSGDAPIIDGTNVFTPGSFTKTDGRTNIYQYSATTNYTNEEVWINVFEDGEFLVNVATLDLCDSTAGSYYVVSHTTATPTIYIHPLGSTNPTTDLKEYRWTARNYCISARYQSNVTIRGVHTRRQYNTSGSIVTGDSCTIIDCKASQGNKHNYYYGQGSTLTNCVAEDMYYKSLGSTLFIINDTYGAGLTTTHNNCSGVLSRPDADCSAFAGHRNVSGYFGPIILNDCTAINCSQGVAYTDGTTVVNINNITVKNCPRAFTITDGTNFNVVGGAYVNDGEGKILLNTQVVSDMVIDGMWVSCGSRSYFSTTVAGAKLTVRNCTLINRSSTAVNQYIAFIEAVGAILSFTHNTYLYPNTTNAYVLYLPNANTLTSDYNTFGKGGLYNSRNGTSYVTVANWAAGTGFDTHSTVLA